MKNNILLLVYSLVALFGIALIGLGAWGSNGMLLMIGIGVIAFNISPLYKVIKAKHEKIA